MVRSVIKCLAVFLFYPLLFSCHMVVRPAQIQPWAVFTKTEAPMGVYTDGDISGMQEAMYFWNALAGCQVFKRSSSFDARVYVQQGPEQILLAGLTQCTQQGGHCLVTIFTYGLQSPKVSRWVATHELGHTLGLGHVDVRTSIMYPSVDPKLVNGDDPPMAVTGDQVAAIRKRYCNGRL